MIALVFLSTVVGLFMIGSLIQFIRYHRKKHKMNRTTTTDIDIAKEIQRRKHLRNPLLLIP